MTESLVSIQKTLEKGSVQATFTSAVVGTGSKKKAKGYPQEKEGGLTRYKGGDE